MAAAPFPPLYQIRAPPDRHATSFECFFFFPLTLHLIVLPCTMKKGGVFWKIADSHPIFHDRDAVCVAEL